MFRFGTTPPGLQAPPGTPPDTSWPGRRGVIGWCPGVSSPLVPLPVLRPTKPFASALGSRLFLLSWSRTPVRGHREWLARFVVAHRQTHPRERRLSIGPAGRQQARDACDRVRVVVVLAGLMVDLPAAPHEAEQLLFEDRHVEQNDGVRVQARFQCLVQFRGAVLGDFVRDASITELGAERLARVPIADDARHPIVAQHAHEPLNRLVRVERRTVALVGQVVQHGAPVGVPMRDAEYRIVVRAARHIHEGDILHAQFRRAHRRAPIDCIEDRLGLKRGPFRQTGQVQVEAPILVRGQAPLLLREVVRVAPTCHRRVRALLGREMRHVR